MGIKFVNLCYLYIFISKSASVYLEQSLVKWPLTWIVILYLHQLKESSNSHLSHKMQKTRHPKSNDKKKRYSQSKQVSSHQYKFSPYQITTYNSNFNKQEHGNYVSTNHNHNHNRSQSIGGNNRNNVRFKTDYEQYSKNNISNINANNNNDKKYKMTYYSKKRNDTENIGNKYSQYETGEQLQRAITSGVGSGIQSTKSNPKKNIELRLLFNKTKHGQQKQKDKDRQSSKKKGYITTMTNHPLFKYVNKNKQMTTNVNSTKSPYTSQIQRFQSLYAKMKNSTSKGKRFAERSKEKQRSKYDLGLSINKHQIKINPKQSMKTNKQQNQQQTVKTIKKVNNQQQNKPTSKSKNEQASYRQDGSEDEDGFGLTQQQQQTFGNRFPYGFEKIKLLGRGGFSLVWLGRHIKSAKQFAIKQIITQNTHQTHIKQIWFGTNFFTLGGIPKPQFSKFPGIKNLVRMYSYEINQSDTWIFYQKCGQSLGSNLYDIKAQRVYGDQRLYKIFYKPFYKAMAQDPKLLKNLIIQICKPLVVLSTCQIVHSDLKTQNILIKFQQQPNNYVSQGGSVNSSHFKLTQTKLIDYGSSFQFKNISQFSMATPEYMPPQILNYIIHENQGEYEQQLYQQVMTNYKKPWIVDIFSLGCVLLQIVVGVPLWMSLPLLVPNKTGISYCQKQGLFAVKGRLFPEIIQKQRKVIAKIDEVLVNENYSKIVLSPATKEVIKGMLCIDFNKRISPARAIELLQNQKQTHS